MKSLYMFIYLGVIILLNASGGEGRMCYNCSSVNDHYCPEYMTSEDSYIVPYVSCDPIYDGRFCIKTTGVNGGSLGTTRFCSSRDMGNYCEYIRRPGDKLEYRSCVFTCQSDGCNNSHILRSSLTVVVAMTIFLTYYATSRLSRL